MTKQREVILDIIKNSEEHLSAEEIFFLAKESLPKIVMATVYNNLNYLTDAGFIRKIKVYNDADRFDKKVIEHDHLICDRCGKIKDVMVKDFIADIEKKYDVEITSYELNLHYICEECSKQEK